jgi:hypothetical protein
MDTLARTLFFTSTSSFFVFLIADLWRPGFVSNYFSVHWVLFLAVGSGLWWSFEKDDRPDRPLHSILAAIGLGIALATVAGRIGDGFGEYLFLVVAVAFLIPLIMFQLLRSSTT